MELLTRDEHGAGATSRARASPTTESNLQRTGSKVTRSRPEPVGYGEQPRECASITATQTWLLHLTWTRVCLRQVVRTGRTSSRSHSCHSPIVKFEDSDMLVFVTNAVITTKT
jgi:hypothetical protein